MATNQFLALLFCLLTISQLVSSDQKHEEATTSEVLPNFDLLKYLKARLVPRASATAPAPSPSHAGSLDCDEKCGHRCSLHSRPHTCARACGTCCARCNCVPPGTSGNREKCGKCYTDMTTHANKTKCP